MVDDSSVAESPTADQVFIKMPDQFALATKTLSKLRTIQIRNQPNICEDPHMFSGEDSYQALAEQLYCALPSHSNFMTIGLDSVGSGYDLIGSNTRYDPWKSFEFRKFRLYHREGGPIKRGDGSRIKPFLVAKGVCDEAEGIVENLSIFRLFWPT